MIVFIENKRVIPIVALLILSILTQVHAEQLGPLTIKTHSFTAGDSVEAEFDWDGAVDIFLVLATLECSAEIDAGFFVGVSLPVEMNIGYPSWLIRDCEFNTTYNARGFDGGRIGIDIHAGLKINLCLKNLLGAELTNWALFDDSKSLDLVAQIATPIGEKAEDLLETKIKIVGIPLEYEVSGVTIIDTEIECYFGAEVLVKVKAHLVSGTSVTSTSLVQEYDNDLVWDEPNETHSISHSTTETAIDNVQLDLDNLKLVMDEYYIGISSFFLEFCLKDLLPVRLAIPIQEGFLSSISSGVELSGEDMDAISIPVIIPEFPMGVAIAVAIFCGIGVISIVYFMARKK